MNLPVSSVSLPSVSEISLNDDDFLDFRALLRLDRVFFATGPGAFATKMNMENNHISNGAISWTS